MITAVVEAGLGLFEVQVERVPGHVLELVEPMRGGGAEAFDAIDTEAAIDGLIRANHDAPLST